MVKDRSDGSVTAGDVAALAGVSRWTVNRAFKKDASISDKSRAKVLSAAEQLGYAPDLLAASLASDRSNLVALLVDDFANPHKLVMMEQLTRILRRNGWDTLLVNTLDETDATSALLTASQRRVDAAVLIGVQFNDSVLKAALGARRVRKLILFARYSENPDTISICCDDTKAMTTITDFVAQNGYRRPLFIAGPQTNSAHLLRKETFMSRWRALKGHGAECLVVGAYDPLQSYACVARHFNLRAQSTWPDILVCENDALAAGAMDALRHDFGLRVPEDIAVTGFDDAPMATNPNYALTTYRQPIAEMAEALVGVLKGEDPARPLDQFTGSLIKRQSA